MPIATKKVAAAAASATALLLLAGCDVEQTQEGELPDINVDADSGQLPEFEQTQEAEAPDVDVDVADGGQLPEYDIDAPDIDVGTREEQVDVPTGVDVETEERSVTVPDVDIDPAGEDEETQR